MSPRNAEPTRTAVLDAADGLLESGGPEAVTLRAVGERAGVSRSAPYRHFDGKADLLAELALRTVSGLGDSIRRAARDSDAEVALRRGCVAYLDFALASPQHYLLVFGNAGVPDPVPAIEAAADDGILAIRELVENAQREGVLREAPPRELATVLWVLLHGLCQLQLTGHLHEPRTVDGHTRLPELLDVALTAWRP